MKSYKLKPLLIAACCAVTALWTEIQGMEPDPIRNINAYQVALTQEEEGEQDLANFNYNRALGGESPEQATHGMESSDINILNRYVESEEEKKLLGAKLIEVTPVKGVSKGYYDARLITPSTHVYLKDGVGYKLHAEASEKIELVLYKESTTLPNPQSRSQVLLKTSTLSLGVSVDTSIRTRTQRKDEKKMTHIQYDKNNIQQDGKDFVVDAKRVDSKNNPKDKTNYDGGHLIDHKFSTQGSHTDNPNYVPQHHYYNSWLKEFLVKNVSGYLEIPLFTPNPPSIKVMNEDRYDSIPIGILLVPLENLKIQAMYYFPNNQYNYRICQNNLNITKNMAQEMISIFKLDKAFHDLLWPAIIHDIERNEDNFAHQVIQELKRTSVAGDIIEGMSIPDLDGEENIIVILTSDVIHQSDVDISNILALGEKNVDAMNLDQPNQAALQQAFNVLGQFLIDYAMKNALKSEILSTHSRIMFANIITDFIECHDEVSEEAFTRIQKDYTAIYKEILKELLISKESMNLRDLIYYANLYDKLSSPDIHPALDEGFNICEDMDLEENIAKFINILELLHNKAYNEIPDVMQMQNLVALFINAQEDISYLINLYFPVEDFAKPMNFLSNAKKSVLNWNSISETTSGSYQTSPNSALYYRKTPGLDVQLIEYLGTISSHLYHNKVEGEVESEAKGEVDEAK
jgi:hypothetical protein